MKKRNIIYIVITIICVLAIIGALYYQIFSTSDKPSAIQGSNNSNQNEENIDLEKIKSDFNSIFTNMLNTQGYTVSENVKKINAEKDVIYAAYEIEKEEKNYSINLNIPVFNISNEIATGFNKITQDVFVKKANDILKSTDESIFTVYNIDFAGYINDDIVSLVIKSTLKEGTNAQRTIVQAYNYDLITGKSVNILDLLEKNNISKDSVNKKIEKQVSYAQNKADAVSSAISQSVYKRDLNSAIYLVDNVTNFFIGENGKIFIIYAYGNSNFTSEMDIIEI